MLISFAKFLNAIGWRKLTMTLIGSGIMWLLFWHGVYWLYSFSYSPDMQGIYFKMWYETMFTIRWAVYGYLGLQTTQNIVTLLTPPRP